MNIFDQCLLKLSTVRNIESPSDCLMMLGPLKSVCVPVVILNEVEGAAGCKESTCSCLWCFKMAAPAGLLSVMNGTRWIRMTKGCFLPWRPLCVLLVVINERGGWGWGWGGWVGWNAYIWAGLAHAALLLYNLLLEFVLYKGLLISCNFLSQIFSMFNLGCQWQKLGWDLKVIYSPKNHQLWVP